MCTVQKQQMNKDERCVKQPDRVLQWLYIHTLDNCSTSKLRDNFVNPEMSTNNSAEV